MLKHTLKIGTLSKIFLELLPEIDCATAHNFSIITVNFFEDRLETIFFIIISK